jgi:hypothetical protein
MQPLSLRLRGFRGIRDGLGLDELTLDLERLADGAALVAIAGANGRGKSTVMDNLHPLCCATFGTDPPLVLCGDSRRGMRLRSLRQLEYADRLNQSAGLCLQALGGGGTLLYQRGILLCGLVHLTHGLTDLGHTGALFGARRTDLAHDVGYPLDAADDLAHRGAGPVHQCRTLLDALDAGGDQGLDLLGCLGRASGKVAHLGGHHREPAALLTSPCGFDRGVQGQDALV